jgi:uncharacterized protein (DUF2126 family)
MPKPVNLRSTLTFGFEQTFTILNWWTDEGFTATSDTPLKREKMLDLTKALVKVMKGSYKESLDIWDHMQYETFDSNGNPSFVVTMDPGSIEVKSDPVLCDQVEDMAKPLFEAAELANVVPYRNWWYGVQGGTEGGCHVNMGGLTPESNPLIKRPDLVVKYSAYIHNRPFLHYPFMGLDVGPEGNAMRMDEKKGFDKVKEAFITYSKLENLSAQETYNHFENTNLITDKASYPSLYKFKSPLFFIEDRGQEALRSAEDFKLVTELRMIILEKLLNDSKPEEIKSFGTDLHKLKLTSYSLWEDYQNWANEVGINPVNYQRFFDRQFPSLISGKSTPLKFTLKEGRRPRVIKDIIKNGETVVSKTVDTSFKRFELVYYSENQEEFDFNIEVEGIEEESPITKHNGFLGLGKQGQAFYKYFDIKFNKENAKMKISLIDLKSKSVIEECIFDINNMQWD